MPWVARRNEKMDFVAIQAAEASDKHGVRCAFEAEVESPWSHSQDRLGSFHLAGLAGIHCASAASSATAAARVVDSDEPHVKTAYKLYPE